MSKDAPHRDAQRRERGSISREEILAAAMSLAAKLGVDGVSMPKLARSLGIGVTSIYWYFRSKEELLEALTAEAARTFSERLAEIPRCDWRDYLARIFTKIRAVLREDDLLCDLLYARGTRLNAEALGYVWPDVEACLASMTEAGFAPEDALHNYYALSHFTRGCVVLERQMRRAGAPMRSPSPDPERFPQLAQLIPTHTLRGVTDAAFAAGLALIIAGVSANLDLRRET